MEAPFVNTTFDLGRTWGCSVGVPFVYNITDDFALISDYSYGYTKINKSNVVAGYFEPESKNYSHTVDIGFRYSF